MKKKKLEIASFIFQSVYSILCIIDVIVCLIYRCNYDGSIGHALAYFALDLTGVLFLLPAMPIGLVLNICALRKRRLEGMPCKRWMQWTILSPVVYIACYLVALIVFVATTGGV